MSVERLFTGGQPPAPTVVTCDWCGEEAVVCTAAERHGGGPPARIGLCARHHEQIFAAPEGRSAGDLAEYARVRAQREAEIRRQRAAWQVRKAVSRSHARGRSLEPSTQIQEGGSAEPGSEPVPAPRDAMLEPLDSEELVASILKGERMVAPIGMVDPRLEDPVRRVERLQAALWPLVRLAEQCGVFADCNPSQTHSVTVVGEVPVQALFTARDLLKRER